MLAYTSDLSLFTLIAFTDIANHIYENPDIVDLNLQGIWIGDRP